MNIPFHTYIIKVASRCNLNCTYCFVYNQNDQRWKLQPKLMQNDTMTQICRRIVEHCKKNNKESVSLIFHGGEPLIGGVKHLSKMVDIIKKEFTGTNIAFSIGIQSNGLLFNQEIGDFCLKNRIKMGVSIDGPPEINDMHRIDFSGNGSSKRLELKLNMLMSYPYNDIFSGFLVVVNLESDPIKLFKYLSKYNPLSIDFIFPYDNWDRRPPGKNSFESNPYGQWMCQLFDFWLDQNSKIRIREFDSYMRLLLGGYSLVESIGTGAVDLIVIETNGDIEAVDSLKATYEGATKLGYNIYQNDFDEVAKHVEVINRQKGADSLCQTCQSCSEVDVCGGGYLPNRFSIGNGFNNPSIYCHDFKVLIEHIRRRLKKELENVAA